MPTQETMDTIEKTLDVVEETLETVERIPKLRLNGTTKRQQIIILGVTATVAALAGGGLSHILTKRVFKLKYEQLAKEEIAEARKYYAILHKKDEFADPISALEKIAAENPTVSDPHSEYAAVVQKIGYIHPEDPVKSEADLASDNLAQLNGNKDDIFEEVEVLNNFVLHEEIKMRTDEAPYVLEHDEFYIGEKDYVQSSLTYFESDNVLIDEHDSRVDDVDETVGARNLSRFGHGSQDPKIVYVRNDKLGVDFEIALSENSYAKEVLGFDDHLEHSDQRGARRRENHGRRQQNRKFRGTDE